MMHYLAKLIIIVKIIIISVGYHSEVLVPVGQKVQQLKLNHAFKSYNAPGVLVICSRTSSHYS